MISRRTKDALRAAKARGVVLGNPRSRASSADEKHALFPPAPARIKFGGRPLMELFEAQPEKLLGDKGYDADAGSPSAG